MTKMHLYSLGRVAQSWIKLTQGWEGGGGLSSSDLKACPQFVHWVFYKGLEKIIRENVSEQEKKKPRLKFDPGLALTRL